MSATGPQKDEEGAWLMSQRPLGQGELALILAAERLFAERGIAGVSLRQINQAANQKNIAAIHYHFGSREKLVRAVLEYRWPRLDRRRGELLRRVNHTKDLGFYLEAFITPLLEELVPRPEGNHYLRFITQYDRTQTGYELARRVSPAGVEIYAQIEKLLFYFPDRVRSVRIGYLINMIHSILAKAEEQMARGEVHYADVRIITSNIIDMLSSALAAPLSARTTELLGRNNRRAAVP
jgi:AcrR family transcriptional regulator